MRTLTLAMVLLTAAPCAWSQGKADCAKLRAGLQTLETSAGRQMTTMMAVALLLETGDSALLSRIAQRLANPIALTGATPEGQTEIIKASTEMFRARDAVLATAGCAKTK